MSTPADELRAAARLLRETAARATPGPWTFTPDLYWDRGAITSTSPDVQGWDVLVMDVHSELEHDNTRWAALANPVIAEPLADLLDSIAAEHEQPPCDAPEVCNRCAEPDPVIIDALRLVLALIGGVGNG